MFDWTALTLFLYVVMRMSGFVLFNPLLGRTGIPAFWKAGLILALSLSVSAASRAAPALPRSLPELLVRLTLELGLGFLLGFLMHLFFSITQVAGETIDSQMGLTMAKVYDAGSQTSMSVTATLLNLLMVLLFFAANGHHTLLRLMLTSGELVPFGTASLGSGAANLAAELFAHCMLLGMKLCLPVLAAELLGEIGMGILLKVIPQINVFVINIELKVIVGLVMLFLLLSPMSDFLLAAESELFSALHRALTLTA